MESAQVTTRIRDYAAALGRLTVDHVKWVANPKHVLDWGHGGLAEHLGLRRDREKETG